MNRLWTASLGLEVPSVGENLLQDVAQGMRRATSSALTLMGSGCESRIYQASSDLLTGTLVVIDDGAITTVNTGVQPATTTTSTVSWSDRYVRATLNALPSATAYPGGANDYTFATGTQTTVWGYLGLGGLNGASGQVSPGNPPVPAAGTSWAIPVASAVWLYLDAADGKRKLYNDSGSTIHSPALWLDISAKTGARP